eukprot:Sspe_Gene.54090::Locus_29864_Transcript_1_1_Confidence_1.000_Length_1443::g.54090::m.54090/K19882/NOTUM; O-palmitoleoyl-L-serine hydrolase
MMINSDEDFLWCFPPGRENLTKTLGGCAVGAGKVGTTPTPIPPNLTVPDLGIPSRNCSSNPVLCNYHKVVIQSCEHANWMGDSYHEAGGMYVYFRGHRILNSTIAQIASDFALNESFSVVITGLTGGGNALYTYADRIGDYLRDTAGVTDYRVVPIDGFWPRWSGYFAQDTFAQVFGGDVSSVTNPERKATMPQVGIYEYANISGSVNPECLADVKNASEAWTCMLAEKALKYVKSRIFAFEQGWGAWGSFCLVNDVIAFMDPLGWRMQCDPRDGSLHLCVEYGWKCNSDYLRDFVNPYIANANATILAPGVLQRPGNGLFMHSCHIGDEETFISTFETIAVDGVTMKDAFTCGCRGRRPPPRRSTSRACGTKPTPSRSGTAATRRAPTSRTA